MRRPPRANRRRSGPKRSSSIGVFYACRAQRTSVAKFGGLPYISRPILNTFDANQIAAQTPTAPTPIDTHTCHHGGGAVDVRRISIAKVLMGGMKLRIVANAEFGFWEIGNQTQNGNVSTSIKGIISACASRMSLTTAPTLTI